MRAIFSKVVAVSMIAGAGLLVTACQNETTATTNNVATEVETTTNGTSDEMVTNLDAANGTGTVVETSNTTTTNTTETSSNTTH